MSNSGPGVPIETSEEAQAREIWEQALKTLAECEQVYLELVAIGEPPPKVAPIMERFRKALGIEAPKREPKSNLILPGDKKIVRSR